MVKFCPRCGAPMIPVKKGKEIYLKCPRCGYEMKADPKTLESYKLRYQVEKDKRVITSKPTAARKAGLTPEEREILKEYYEVFLETFQEEEGGQE
jgi:DNA-directed RNA polymerase subunit M